MTRECAWCGASLDPPAESEPAAVVSHGICDTCHARLSLRSGVSIGDFVARLDEPVLVMDSDHTVGMLNEAAAQLLGHDAATAIGQRTGMVFDCQNAHMSGGCGNTIHCAGCAIRNAVLHTHRTGESRIDIPATLKVVDDAEPADLDMVISTVRVGSRVLLKIRPHDA